MALTVEDGTGKSNANSYVSDSDYTAYSTARGQSVGADATAREKEIIQAMDYIESLDFIGTKNTKEQALQWPRYGAWIDGYSVDTNEIPQLLKDAVMEAAVSISGSLDPLATVERATKKEKLEGLEVEYMDGASEYEIIRRIEAKIDKLISSSNMMALRV